MQDEFDVVREEELPRRGAVESGGAVVEDGLTLPAGLPHDALE